MCCLLLRCSTARDPCVLNLSSIMSQFLIVADAVLPGGAQLQVRGHVITRRAADNTRLLLLHVDAFNHRHLIISRGG